LWHSGFNEAAQCENTVRFSFRADTPAGQPRKVKVMTFLARVKAPSQVAKNCFAGNLVYYIMIYSSNVNYTLHTKEIHVSDSAD